MSMRPSGDTARGLVFDDFVDKQVVHVSATSFRSGAELVSMISLHQAGLIWISNGGIPWKPEIDMIL